MKRMNLHLHVQYAHKHIYMYSHIFTHTVRIIKVFLNFVGIFFFVLSCQNFFSPCISALRVFSTKVLKYLCQDFLVSAETSERSVAHCSEYQLTSFMNHWFLFIGPGKSWHSVGIYKEYMESGGMLHICLFFTSPLECLATVFYYCSQNSNFLCKISINQRSLKYIIMVIMTVQGQFHNKEMVNLFSSQKII